MSIPSSDHSELAAPFRLCSSHGEAAPLTAGLDRFSHGYSCYYLCVSVPLRRARRKDEPVPAGAGDRAGDLGQAAVGGAVPGEAVLQCHDVADPTGPLPHQDGAGLDRDRASGTGRWTGSSLPQVSARGDLIRVASRGEIEVAMSGRRQLVGRSRSREMLGRCRAPAGRAGCASGPAGPRGRAPAAARSRPRPLPLAWVERHGLRPPRSGRHHRRPPCRPARSGRRSCRPRAAPLQSAALAPQAGERRPGGVRQPAGGGDQLVQRGTLLAPAQPRDQRLLGAGAKQHCGRWLRLKQSLAVRRLTVPVGARRSAAQRAGCARQWDPASPRAARGEGEHRLPGAADGSGFAAGSPAWRRPWSWGCA